MHACTNSELAMVHKRILIVCALASWAHGLNQTPLKFNEIETNVK